ncbi:MAG: hypothetical protein LBE51_06745 [Acidovorax sp.]|jgi:hypothetical protein|nr:hypothetical protein [Acidovorax sp.]
MTEQEKGGNPMPNNGQSAQDAIKNDCAARILPYVIKYLEKEKAAVTAELETMAVDAWLNARGRALANREQELHITLTVLHGLAPKPMQIEEPAL